ncbi:MAG: alpha/beta hydrolase, partial [bacterium]
MAAVFIGTVVYADLESDQKVVYKTVGNTKLQLHVFKPKDHKAEDRRACIVFFFGGGWEGGTPSQFY